MDSREFILKILDLQEIANELSNRIELLNHNYQKKEDENTRQASIKSQSVWNSNEENIKKATHNRKEWLEYWDKYIQQIDSFEKAIQDSDRNKAGYNKTAFSSAQPDFNILNQLLAEINKKSFLGRVAGNWKESVWKYLDIIGQGKSYAYEKKAKVDSDYRSALSVFNERYQKELLNIEQEKNEQSYKNNAELTEKCNKVIEHYTKLLAPQMNFYKDLTNFKSFLGVDADCWVQYYPSSKYPSGVMIGNISQEIQIPDLCSSLIPEIPWDKYKNLTIPLVMDFFSPLNLYIKYSEDNHDVVFSGINSILLRIISKMPINSFRITYVDPIARGSNLKRLKVLSELNGCHICGKPAANKTDVALQLKILENLVDELSLTLATIGTVYDYNNLYKNKINYNIIVLNDFPNGLVGSALDSLEVIINNANKCGISVIITQKDNEKMEHSLGDLVEKIQDDFQIIDATTPEITVKLDGNDYPFAFSDENMVSIEYIDGILDEYSKGSVRDNSFKRIFDSNSPVKYLDSKVGLSIPFAIDSHNQICEIEVGGTLTSHSMVSGSTGSGKSNTLHALIAGILLNYHPDDVELWLVDYKRVEFAEYLKNTPPHVKIIGLERTEEFTFSLLDKLKEEFEYRMELFTKAHVTTIEAYNSLENVRSLPRIVLIIDEFHNLTQTIQGNQYYMTLFENALSEYRVFGLSCILSDQTIREGLRGMTDKGRMQVHNRIAMRNDISEIKDTLAVDNSYYSERLLDKIRTLGQGELVFKKEFKTRFGDTQTMIDKYLTLLITAQDREDLLKYIHNNVVNYRKKDLIVVEGQRRIDCNENDIQKMKGMIPQNKVALYIGTPSSLNPCFILPLEQKIDENVIVIGNDYDMRFSIIYYSIKSYLDNSSRRVLVFAHPDDDLYLRYKKYFRFRKNFKVINDISDICDTIQFLKESVSAKQNHDILLVTFGLDSIFEDMESQGKMRLSKEKASTVSDDSDYTGKVIKNVDSWIADFQKRAGLSIQQSSTDSETSMSSNDSNISQNKGYDARNDFVELLSIGSRYGVHIMANFESVKFLKRLNRSGFKLDTFKHKIALQMTKDEGYLYLDNSKYVTELDEISAIYNDSGSSYKLFRPYLLPTVEK